jgi:hypothetical protein
MRIREGQKHTDPDPQHCCKGLVNATAMATDAVVTLLMVMSLVTEVTSTISVVTVVRGMRTWNWTPHCETVTFQTKPKRKKMANFFIFSDPP